jgi:phage terminase large subunit-like protein
MTTTKTTPTTCSTEADVWRAIDELVAELVESGDVLDTGWPGEPLLVTPPPAGPDVVFDPARVRKVVRVLGSYEQSKGRWGGHPLKLLDWQVRYEIAPVFGLVDATTGCRIIRTAWFEKPRKNGKSTECSGLGLYLAFSDGEPGAEVYAAAATKDQARIVFNPARLMAERCQRLRQRIGPRNITAASIYNPSTASVFKPLAADQGGNLHGLNVHGGIVDEVHVHKTPDTIDALETGTGSREQPLVVFITTADDGRPGSVYDTKRNYLERCASRVIVDRTFYGVVFAASEVQIAEAPFSDETLIAANPGVGYTVTLEYLRGKANEARNSPPQMNRYLRLHLGKRTKQAVRWFSIAAFDQAVGLRPELSEWKNARAYAGLDLSSVSDFTAATFLAPDPHGDGYIGDLMLWCPEDAVDELEHRLGVPLRQWNREGFITFTEGNVVDYARVRRELKARRLELGCKVVECAYDPWNATETVQHMERDGWTMVPIRQGYASLNPPCKELERLIVGSGPGRPLLRFGWNPALRWMADCVEVTSDPAGNIKPAKPDRYRASQRIDGIASTVNALARAMLRPTRRRASSFG